MERCTTSWGAAVHRHIIRKNPSKLALRALLFVSFFMASNSGLAFAERGASATPNVLIIMSDDQRADFMGNAGNPVVSTPNMDLLAREGVRFTNFVSQSPVCIPTRASIMTGMYQTAHNVRPYVPMDVDTTYLAEVFANAGYVTGYGGKWHLNGSPFGTAKDDSFVPPGARAGFQEWDGYDTGQDHDRPTTFDESQDPPEIVEVEEYDWAPSYYSDVFLNFAQRNSAREAPWMYFLSYGMPHSPEKAPELFLQMYPPDEFDLDGLAPNLTGNITVAEETRMRNILQSYCAQISFIDDEIGIILEGLERLGLDENTIVVFFSDHGQLLGSHYDKAFELANAVGIAFRFKSLPYAGAFRAPLIMRWPDTIPSDIEVDGLMSTVDLPATILDLARLDVPAKMQGQSMRQWCLGGVGPDIGAKYLSSIYPNISSWEAVFTREYIYCSSENLELLYDHINDPKELNNLYDDPAYAEVRMELQELLDELAVEAVTIPSDDEENGSGGSSTCLISAVTFDSTLGKDLDTFRSIRDGWLLNNAIGRMISRTYYQLNPRAIEAISGHVVTRNLTLAGLWILKKVGNHPIVAIPLIIFLSFYIRKFQRTIQEGIYLGKSV